MSGSRRVFHQLLVTWWLQLKMAGPDTFNRMLNVLWPLFFATTAFLVYRITHRGPAIVYAGLGASIMGIWSAVATTAGGALQRERWLGTLELIVSAPTPIPLVLIPITMAMATIGLFSLGLTLLWGWLVFDIPFRVGQPVAFALALFAMVLAIAMFGFLMSVTIVRYRTAWALGNLFQYPGWLLCGFVVPLSVLPDWVRPICYALSPTWGMLAIRQAAAGDWPWIDGGVCLGLTALCGVAATLLSERVLRSARRHASLSLT
ncbi:MAG TPA: ABC transporter permease [Streptosporangiaceae bacterium]